MQFEHTIWMGDLNYRVDKFTYDETVAMVGEGNCHILAQVRHAPHTPHTDGAPATGHVTDRHLPPPLSPPISHAPHLPISPLLLTRRRISSRRR